MTRTPPAMKKMLLLVALLVLFHGKGPDIEAPKEGPKGPNTDVHNVCERDCK